MKYAKPRNPEGRQPIYGKAKNRVNLSLTDEATSGLDEIAASQGLSRSELIERIGRGVISLNSDASTEVPMGKSLGASQL